MAYNIGFFTKTDGGFKGNIQTLAIKVPAEFTRVLDRTHENSPAFEIFSDDLKIGGDSTAAALWFDQMMNVTVDWAEEPLFQMN